jgi:hypothetical protein
LDLGEWNLNMSLLGMLLFEKFASPGEDADVSAPLNWGKGNMFEKFTSPGKDAADVSACSTWVYTF